MLLSLFIVGFLINQTFLLICIGILHQVNYDISLYQRCISANITYCTMCSNNYICAFLTFSFKNKCISSNLLTRKCTNVLLIYCKIFWANRVLLMDVKIPNQYACVSAVWLRHVICRLLPHTCAPLLRIHLVIGWFFLFFWKSIFRCFMVFIRWPLMGGFIYVKH